MRQHGALGGFGGAAGRKTREGPRGFGRSAGVFGRSVSSPIPRRACTCCPSAPPLASTTCGGAGGSAEKYVSSRSRCNRSWRSSPSQPSGVSGSCIPLTSRASSAGMLCTARRRRRRSGQRQPHARAREHGRRSALATPARAGTARARRPPALDSHPSAASTSTPLDGSNSIALHRPAEPNLRGGAGPGSGRRRGGAGTARATPRRTTCAGPAPRAFRAPVPRGCLLSNAASAFRTAYQIMLPQSYKSGFNLMGVRSPLGGGTRCYSS